MRVRPSLSGRGERGAVAATYAIAVLPLIVVAGVGYDYSRMVSLDSELQNAADQAALAAVTQLDRTDGACERASNAAVGLLRNLTVLSNDGRGNRVTITGEPDCDASGWIRFYKDQAKTPATSDDEARFVEVHVNPRAAFYALTPVMASFAGSGDLHAAAFAGIDNAVCKTAPVMICNPNEETGDPDFIVENYIGKGLKLISQGGGSGNWAPGNFGYLKGDGYSNGAPGLREGLGWESLPGNCQSYDGVDTKPGVSTTVTDAINTRFDIYQNANASCPSGGACPASGNSVKDFKRPNNANGGNACRIHNQGWQLPTGYYGSTPVSATVPLATTVTPSTMGHPRDMCHLAVSGRCTTPFGNGLWDRDAYFRTNYRRADNSYWTQAQWQSHTGLGSSATRYDVYKWEMDNRGTTIDGVTILGPNPATAVGNTLKSYGRPVCSQAQSPSYGTGSIPDDDTPDRRVLTVAVVNCRAQSVNGNSTNVQVAEWIDVFLVEPSSNRADTNEGDLYVEIIGKSKLGGGSAGAQQIVKSVPNLIE